MITEYSSPTSTGITEREGGTGGNVKFQRQILAGQTLYFLVRKQSGSYGEIGFRIICDDYIEYDQTNYRDIAQTNYQGGNLDSNENPGEWIDYKGDVDIYVFKTYPGDSYLEIPETETILGIDVYTVEGTQDNGFDELWHESSLSVTTDISENMQVWEQSGYSNAYTYFEIRNEQVGSFFDELFAYDFNFYPSNYKDEFDRALEFGNNPVTPTAIEITDTIQATLGRGDTDYYKFNSGQGGDFSAKLFETEETYKQYDIGIYPLGDVEIINTNPPEWYPVSNVGTVTSESGYQKLTYTLATNTDYILEVSRPDSNTYDSHPGHYYTLETSLSQPSAMLSGNVTLNHTVGNNISSLDAFMDTVMESLTCKDGDDVISDSVAKNNVVLYYNNSALTAQTVNGLAAGDYTIVAKYKGVTATGGTVTLHIAEATPDDMVELSNIVSSAPIDFVELDWIYSAMDMANSRLAHEDSPASTKTVNDVAEVFGLDPDNFLVERRPLGDTLKATSYFYSNGASQSGVGFSGTTNANLLTVDEIYDKVSAGQAVIIQIVDFDHRTDMNYANYLLLCGANKTTQKLKVKNYVTGEVDWVLRSDLINGGYDESNPNVKFSGAIIESVS